MIPKNTMTQLISSISQREYILKQMCDEVHGRLAIHQADYVRVYSDNSIKVLSTHSAYVQMCLEMNTRFVTTIENNGVVIWDQHADKLDFVGSAKENFNIRNGISLIQDKKQYLEIFSISATESKSSQVIFSFLKEIEYLFECCQNLSDKVDILFKGNTLFPLKLDNRNFRKHNADQLKLEKLTRRESQIVTLLKNGYSPKEIGENLLISKRTVEMHIQNARQKFHCRNSIELVNILLTHPQLIHRSNKFM